MHIIDIYDEYIYMNNKSVRRENTTPILDIYKNTFGLGSDEGAMLMAALRS